MEPKGHIVKLPVVSYPNYDRLSTELVVSIPLFYSAKDTTFADFNVERFEQIHCKGAIWSAMALLYNTDLCEKGVGVFFHIEDKAWEHAKPMFEAFGVDEKWIRIVNVPEGEPLQRI